MIGVWSTSLFVLNVSKKIAHRGIKAAGQNPAEWKVGSNDPIGHLLSLQKQNGSIWWKSDSEGLSFEWTADMIVALSGGEMPPAII